MNEGFNPRSMKNVNTFGVFFYLKKYKAIEGVAPIYARITVDGKRADVSTKQSVNAKDWSGKKGCAKGTRDEIRSLNFFLEQMRSGFVSTYQDLFIQRKLITAQTIKQTYLGVEEKQHSLKKIIDYHDKQAASSLAWGTLKNYGATQKYLEKFLRLRFKADDIFLSELSYKFVIDFEHFLRTTNSLDKNQPLTNNGIMKHMERFKKLIGLAVRMDWIEKDPFNKYKLKFEEVDRESLTKDELATIENGTLDNQRLVRVRDMFVFSCYTGLAYIDMISLKADDISIGIDGGYWIFVRRKKSNKPVRVPLLPEAMAVLNKYKNSDHVKAFGTVFPMISNQKVNQYLKEIATKLNIEKPITFHLARHTFATTVTLTNGVPIETVSKMLGHTNIRTTQIYSKVIESKISEDMAALRRKLSLTKQEVAQVFNDLKSSVPQFP